MVSIKQIALPLALLCLLAEPSRGGPKAGIAEGSSLFAQSAARALDREFPGRDISFLLLDAPTGEVLASRWEHPENPIPLGSLVKPFAALAYGQKHNFQYPIHTCRGTTSGCWRPGGARKHRPHFRDCLLVQFVLSRFDGGSEPKRCCGDCRTVWNRNARCGECRG